MRPFCTIPVDRPCLNVDPLPWLNVSGITWSSNHASCLGASGGCSFLTASGFDLWSLFLFSFFTDRHEYNISTYTLWLTLLLPPPHSTGPSVLFRQWMGVPAKHSDWGFPTNLTPVTRGGQSWTLVNWFAFKKPFFSLLHSKRRKLHVHIHPLTHIHMPIVGSYLGFEDKRDTSNANWRSQMSRRWFSSQRRTGPTCWASDTRDSGIAYWKTTGNAQSLCLTAATPRVPRAVVEVRIGISMLVSECHAGFCRILQYWCFCLAIRLRKNCKHCRDSGRPDSAHFCSLHLNQAIDCLVGA